MVCFVWHSTRTCNMCVHSDLKRGKCKVICGGAAAQKVLHTARRMTLCLRVCAVGLVGNTWATEAATAAAEQQLAMSLPTAIAIVRVAKIRFSIAFVRFLCRIRRTRQSPEVLCNRDSKATFKFRSWRLCVTACVCVCVCVCVLSWEWQLNLQFRNEATNCCAKSQQQLQIEHRKVC